MQLHRPTTAQLCIRAPLHPPPPAPCPRPLDENPSSILLSLSLFLSFLHSLPLSFSPSTPHPFPSRRVSRPSPGPRATTESTTAATASRGMLCAAPVNVTLKTERACTYTANLRCAVRGRAPARATVSYVRERWTLIN